MDVAGRPEAGPADRSPGSFAAADQLLRAALRGQGDPAPPALALARMLLQQRRAWVGGGYATGTGGAGAVAGAVQLHNSCLAALADALGSAALASCRLPLPGAIPPLEASPAGLRAGQLVWSAASDAAATPALVALEQAAPAAQCVAALEAALCAAPALQGAFGEQLPALLQQPLAAQAAGGSSASLDGRSVTQ
jgi:hypothetical protein